MIYIESFRFEDYNENSYVIFTGNRDCFIIDPGCYTKEETESIVRFIESNDLIPRSILITHAHIDHIFGVAPLSALFNIGICIHEKEYNVLLNMPKIGEKFGYQLNLYTGQYTFINEDDTIKLDNHTLRIQYTPGHTQNSVSFYNNEFNLLFSGDVLFKDKIGKVNLPGGNYDKLVNTIKNKLFLLPNHTIVYPGHGQPTTIGHEKEHNKMEIWD